ncbi:helix-hairpin-helix domain-containing protein [Neptunicella sp. SCSIO 80796]|uniref:helix-hairpin-helix domain-containing protein n=1 Tax=Neptunicella plasticusilytica TaxID=3117012 RepID=UPI003A4E2F50
MSTDRKNIQRFQDIPNIGPAMERDFIQLGLKQPAELIGQDPYQLYQQLSTITGVRQDPCVLDTYMAAVDYMQGGSAKKWWEFTKLRKKNYPQL